MSSRKEAYERVGSSTVGSHQNAEHYGLEPNPALSIDRNWRVEIGLYRADIAGWSSPPNKAKRLLQFIRDHEGQDLGVVFFNYADGSGCGWDGRADLWARASMTGPTSFEIVLRRRSG